MLRRWLRLARLTVVLLAVGCQVSVTPRHSSLAPPLDTPVPLPTLPPPTATLAPTAIPTATPEPTPEPTAIPTAVPTAIPTTAPQASLPAGQQPQTVRPPAGPPVQVQTVPCPPPLVPPRLSYIGRETAGPVLRPVIVQIDNAIPARPALNLSHASTVYESVAEGGVTRFSALFNKDDPGTVGPVRSARLVSLEVARQFEALLVYHGASTGVQNRIWNGGIYFVSFNTPDTFPIHGRLNNRPAPHNSITSLPQIRQYARSHGVPTQVDDWPDFPRGDVKAPSMGQAQRLAVGFSGPGGSPWSEYRAEWRYVPEEGRYLRSTGGRADVDGVTREQIGAETVVVQLAPVVVTDIIEDVFGSRSLDYQMHGEGKALYFRNGQYWEGCWRRPGAFEPTIFVGPDGNVFPFGRGSVWIAVAAPETPIWRES